MTVCRQIALWMLVTAILPGMCRPAFGQFQANPFGPVGGIRIDADGVVTNVPVSRKPSALQRKRMAAASAQRLGTEINTSSPLRKVSLVLLEEACRAALEKGTGPTEAMMFLAGLQRIDYVFAYPELGDLVLAGPAGGFTHVAPGRTVGNESGRPPIHLDDLLVALRSVVSGRNIGCSIDPEPERLAGMQRYIARNSGASTVSVAKARYRNMAGILGMQTISIFGVPPDSHFARVLVEADYRMKRISMGLDAPLVRVLRSHLSMIEPGGNSLRRWWFVPLYEAISKTVEGDAFALSGPRAQLLAQEELSDAAGRRSDAAFTPLSTRKFAEQFTAKFPELAERAPVFAELQNLIDLAIVAALMRREGLPDRIGWTQSLFLDNERLPIQTGVVPQEVPSVANVRMIGGRLIVGVIGGGVQIGAQRTIASLPFKPAPRLGGLRSESIRERSEARWWWD